MFRTLAIAALIANASAVTIKSKLAAHTTTTQTTTQGGPPSWEEILEVLDEDGNNKVSWAEITNFMDKIEEEHGVTIPESDRKEIEKVFNMVDADGSGEIDKDEFEAAMADAGALGQRSKKAFSQLKSKAKQGPPSWEDILEVLDEDGNGKVSWEEMTAFLEEIEEEHGIKIPESDKKEIKKVFDMVDADGSGEIDKDEFEAAMKDAGALGQRSKKSFKKLAQMKSKAKQGAPSWEDVLEVLDENGNGKVSWEEVLGFIQKIEKEHDVKISKKDKEAIKAGFDAVDTDGSGEVDKDEFEAAVAASKGLGQLKKLF